MDAVSILILLSVSGWAIAGYAWFIRGVDKCNAGYNAGQHDSQEACRLAGCSGIGNDGDHHKDGRKRQPMADIYPKYYKDVRHIDSVDVYRVHRLRS
jgi:hypothetical protein